MLLRRGLFCIFGVLALTFPACTAASGDVSGGEARFDASSPPAFVSTATSGEPTYADASPTSWKGIYRDFFGRHATATCAGNGTCHGGPTQSGTITSNFLCVDLDGCYKSLRTSVDPNPAVTTHALVEATDIPTPAMAYLFRVISYRTADGTLVPNRKMPQLPVDFAFSDDDITRMQTWIKNGALND